jgi:hypothetical protein
MKGRRTDLPTAALVMELKETEGRSENEITTLTGIPAGTVHNIVSRAHGWDKIADGDLFKRHRQEQSRALEQAKQKAGTVPFSDTEKLQKATIRKSSSLEGLEFMNPFPFPLFRACITFCWCP